MPKISFHAGINHSDNKEFIRKYGLTANTELYKILTFKLIDYRVFKIRCPFYGDLMMALQNSEANLANRDKSAIVKKWADRGLLRSLFSRFDMARDQPHQLALGAAIGVFFALTPTLPIQSLLTVFSAFLLRANKLTALSTVWLNNPLTMVPIYSIAYLGGCAILGIESQMMDWNLLVSSDLPMIAYTQLVWAFFLKILDPLLVGSFCMATASAVIVYTFTLVGIRIARARERVEM